MEKKGRQQKKMRTKRSCPCPKRTAQFLLISNKSGFQHRTEQNQEEQRDSGAPQREEGLGEGGSTRLISKWRMRGRGWKQKLWQPWQRLCCSIQSRQGRSEGSAQRNWKPLLLVPAQLLPAVAPACQAHHTSQHSHNHSAPKKLRHNTLSAGPHTLLHHGEVDPSGACEERSVNLKLKLPGDVTGVDTRIVQGHV